MASCEGCLFHGTKKDIADKGSCVFCPVKGTWMQVAKKCGYYRDNDGDISADIKNSIAMDLRLEETENRRLKAIVKSTRFSMILAFIVAFLFFVAVTKFYDKFLF